jgi:hypothetical protein
MNAIASKPRIVPPPRITSRREYESRMDHIGCGVVYQIRDDAGVAHTFFGKTEKEALESFGRAVAAGYR